MLSNTTTPNQTSNHFNDQLNLLDKLLDDIDKLDELDRLPPPKKRSSNRNRNENGNGYRIRAKAPPFPIPTPPELREWANRHRQVRIALPVSNSDSGSDSGATQLAIVSPYSEEQEPPLLVSSSSMGAGSGIGTPSSSSDDGPLTPDSDQIHGGHGVPGFGYFTSQRKAEVSVDEDQDQDSMVFGTIGKKSKLTSSLRAPYRSLKAGREEAVRVEHVKADEVKVKVEVVKREETKAEVIEGAKVVERPPQTLPPPEWTGGQEWRKFRYMDKETSEPKETFDIHSWGAAKRAAALEEESVRKENHPDPSSANQEYWRDITKLTSLGAMTCMICASIPRLHHFVETGFGIDPVEWVVVGSSFTFFVASVCGVIGV